MKKLPKLFLALLVAGIIWFCYEEYRRSHTPFEYEYIPSDWIYDSIDFVIDSTVERQYPEDIMPFRIEADSLFRAEDVFQAVKPLLEDWEDFAIEKPYRIRQMDTIWIIEGSWPKCRNDEIVFGGVAYIEITTNGTVLKNIRSE